MHHYNAWRHLSNLSLTSLKLAGLGPKRLETLAAAGIETALDLLAHLPRAYRDYSIPTPVGKLQPDTDVAVCGRLLSLHAGRTARKRIPILEGLIDDGTGTVRVVWYRQAYLKDKLCQQETYRVWGQTRRESTGITLTNPKIRALDEAEEALPIEVVYPVVGGLPSSMFAKWIALVISAISATPSLPPKLAGAMAALDFAEAIRIIHTPDQLNPETAKPFRYEKALNSLKAMEFLAFQVQMKRFIHASQNSKLRDYPGPWGAMKAFFDAFPFEATGDQRRVIRGIWECLNDQQRILALVQGDVGSGKTMVALAAAFLLINMGYQVAMMAPTTILARQHCQTASQYLSPLGIRVGLLSGDVAPRENRRVIGEIGKTEIDLIIGTHMLFGDAVRIPKLGLVMIDEQHRFGVGQRGALLKKGDCPHYLAFSATPIPRSLALTLYGDFHVYQIKEKPARRQPVRTILKYQKNREEVLAFAKSRITRGEGVFWVLPLIEGESLAQGDSAEAMAKYLRKSGIEVDRLGLVHGGLEKATVAQTMADFREGELDILVATTVVEVGVDIPRASIMIIDGAQHFGLSQLHQLRGRVGRDAQQAYCFLLVPKELSPNTLKRMRLLEQTEDGFQIAEADLAMRGAGHLLGNKQSGRAEFYFADPWQDRELMVSVRNWLDLEGRRGAMNW